MLWLPPGQEERCVCAENRFCTAREHWKKLDGPKAGGDHVWSSLNLNRGRWGTWICTVCLVEAHQTGAGSGLAHIDPVKCPGPRIVWP